MKFLILSILFSLILVPNVYGQTTANPSLVLDTIEIDSDQFNRILRDSPIIELDKIHAISWQVTIDNNLLYANPEGNAVLRLYDNETHDEFIEIGMGSIPDNKFWVAVQTPDEGYIVVHRDLDRGWYPTAKTIVSFTERAGLTVNNGARIVVTNLDIGSFSIDAYSTHGMEGSSDPPAVNSGVFVMEILSGDPGKNVFAMFPFYIAAAIGILVGVLFLTKKRK
jgi:hypothetical protein